MGEERAEYDRGGSQSARDLDSAPLTERAYQHWCATADGRDAPLTPDLVQRAAQ